MASLRKASAYSKRKVRPYTRKSGKKKHSYIKAVPQNKIVKYNMGNQKFHNDGKNTHVVTLIATERVQMRDNALESCRQFINKIMDRESPGNYYFIVKVYPHHILRENKTAAGAGADRLSSGMKHSFGVTMGRAALIAPGKEIFFISCANEKCARAAKKTLENVKSKIPCKSKVSFEKIN